MPLTVLNIAFPFAAVSPETAGGAEQILGALDQALVAAGHTSLVAASEGSRPAGKLFSFALPFGKELDEPNKRWCRKQLQAAIDRALASQPVDLVHMHGMDFHEYTLPPHLPALVTLHMPLSWHPSDIWSRLRRRYHFCCVSNPQQRSCPPELKGCSVIENGVEFPPDWERTSGDYALVMGRICPEKNAHEALEAGSLAGTQVLLAGQVFAYREHQEYLRTRLQPLLNTPADHRLLGPQSPAERRALLREAKCLLHPTLAPETSSLVAMEALAAGVPVIAYPSGALAEIVEHGVSGLLVNNVREMADAIRNVEQISRAECRRQAEARFSQQRMIDHYFALYQSLAQKTSPVRRYA